MQGHRENSKKVPAPSRVPLRVKSRDLSIPPGLDLHTPVGPELAEQTCPKSLELGGAAWAAMEAHMRDLSTALGFSSHVGVTTWSQRNFGTLYMVTSPAYQALL